MERGPALFAGVVLACFGAALLAWTAGRMRGRRAVTAAGGPAAAVVSVLAGAVAFGAGLWCLTLV